MPAFVTLDELEYRKMKEQQGLGKETINKRGFIIKHFQEFVANKDASVNYETVIQDKVLLEDAFCKFLLQPRIGDDLRLPKRIFLESYKSHLRCQIPRNTNVCFDITNRFIFKEFCDVFKGMIMKTRKEGFGETSHYSAFPYG